MLAQAAKLTAMAALQWGLRGVQTTIAAQAWAKHAGTQSLLHAVSCSMSERRRCVALVGCARVSRQLHALGERDCPMGPPAGMQHAAARIMGPYLQVAARHLHEGHQREHWGGLGPSGPLSQLRRKVAASAAAVACPFTTEWTIVCIRHVLQMRQ